MAKSPKNSVHPTTKPSKSDKLSSKRNSHATPKLSRDEIMAKVHELLATIPCTCGCDCTGLSSGGVFTCEDGTCTYIPKPNYFAVLVSDPNFALPYWCRPSDLGLNCPTSPSPTPVPLGKMKSKKAV